MNIQLKMGQVLEDNQPATLLESDIWKNNFFLNFDEALQYVKDWLGMYNPGLPENWQGEPFDYGYVIKIEIRFQDGIETP